jgi:hypothetical protein
MNKQPTKNETKVSEEVSKFIEKQESIVLQ